MSNINPGGLLPQLFVDGLPIGSVTAYAGNSTPPQGFLWLRKAKLKKTTYATLFGIIGTTFNDGSQAADEFMLPDAEGYFVRNFDNSGLVDAGRVFGSKQADQLQDFTPAGGMVFSRDLGTAGSVPYYNQGGGTTQTDIAWDATSAAPDSKSMGKGFVVEGNAGAVRMGQETRPKNIALNYIIKASLVYTQQQLMAAGGTYSPDHATESTDGVVKLATQGEVDTGTDDFKAVTSKKLKLGFQLSLTANGYVAFPTWMGGFSIQWGKSTGATSGNNTVTFPFAFPNACLFTMATIDAEQTSTADTSRQPLTNGKTTTTATFYVGQTESNGAAIGPFNWLALGY